MVGPFKKELTACVAALNIYILCQFNYIYFNTKCYAEYLFSIAGIIIIKFKCLVHDFKHIS